MSDDDHEDRSVLQRAAHNVKDTLTDPNLESGLANQAGAMPAAAGDLNFAGAASPAGGPASGFTPGAGAAAAGSLTDEEPVGREREPESESDR